MTLDFWFDFASTYSYPAAMRIEKLAITIEGNDRRGRVEDCFHYRWDDLQVNCHQTQASVERTL